MDALNTGTFAIFLMFGSVAAMFSWAEETVPYGVAPVPWAPELGNHRARLEVTEAAQAVWAHIPWRRRDPAPQEKRVVILAPSGQAVANVAVVEVNREFGDVVFQPTTGPGEYLAYYMPYTVAGWAADYRLTYTRPEQTADPAWLDRHGLRPEQLGAGAWRQLPQARVAEIQARSEFHRFDPMEVIATAQETADLLAQHPQTPYLLFPEDRRYPIRMTDDLPVRWITSGPGQVFRGEAQPGEFYTWQIGVFAARQELRDMTTEIGDLRTEGDVSIPAGEVHAFNFGGTDWLGRPIRKSVTVPQGKVQALWFGVQVPANAPAGVYRGYITLRPANAPATTVQVTLTVAGEVLLDGGERELWRMARLKWLDSTIGLDDEVVAPYTPLEVDGQRVKCLGREVRYGATGLPDSIRSSGREILQRPMSLVVETPHGPVAWSDGGAHITRTAPAVVTWEAESRGGPFRLRCAAKMEADGYLNFMLTLHTGAAAELRDVRLEIPLRRDVARYLMGMGRKGGLRPPEWSWKWDAGRANNMVWVGDYNAGLQCKLKGPRDTWDIYSLVDGVPQTWGNDGKGGATITEQGEDTVLIRAYTGERAMQAGEELELRFGLLITPVKPLDPAHWGQRYYHLGPNPIAHVLACGANIINIHHGNDLNPNINYPFLAVDRLAAYVQEAHAQGLKVKIYYTVRELSDYVAEMFALRSLGFEVFTDGPGGGASWLREHLVSHYAPAWHHMFADGEVDGAIVTQGLSRWHNYYLEGLRWLIEHVGIDGLYLDGIGYDREVMKRVRKVMDRARPGCLIDFHSGNEFPFGDLRVSPANKYMEHFPYINSLWFGEGYDYNETPDYWLVEISGIPFGLYGEMLQDNGNPWRGMVYGMTARYYSGADPKHIWKLWDEFGIQDAQMIGYWDPACPVKAEREDVLATAYVKPGKTLIAVASWAKAQESVRCRLQVEWEKLGLDPQKASFYAPPIQGFQPARVFKPADEIPFAPRRGWLLIVDEQPHEAPASTDQYQSRNLLLEDRFDRAELGEAWQVALSSHPGTKLALQDNGIQLTAAANVCAFAERPLPPGTSLVECRVFSGTDGGVSWGTGLGLLWPTAFLRLNVSAFHNYQVRHAGGEIFGGFQEPSTWSYLRLRLEPEQVYAEVSPDGQWWDIIAAFPRNDYPGDPIAVRVGKMSPAGECEDYAEPGPVGTSVVTELRAWGSK